jgi:hypothetical protein
VFAYPILSHGHVRTRSSPAFVVNRPVARRFSRTCPSMTDSFPPTIAPQTDSSGNAPESAQQSPDPADSVPITEQEVGEYREQDRYLPVSPSPTFTPSRASVTRPFATALSPLPLFLRWRLPRCVDSKCVTHHEKCGPTHRQNREGRQGMCSGVCVGVHQLHNVRSGREMPARETQDDRRRGHPLRDGLARL